MNIVKSSNNFIAVIFAIALASVTASAQTTNDPTQKQSLFDLNQINQNVKKVPEQKLPAGQTKPVPQPSVTVDDPNLRAKKAGYTRIGIVGAGGEAAADAYTLAATVKFLESLDGKDFAPFETFRLTSTNTSFISAEAAKNQCDYILYIEDVTSVKKSGFGMGKIVSKLKDVVTRIPGMIPGSLYWEAFSKGQKVMNAADMLNAVAGQTKAKEKISVTYKLVPAGVDAKTISSQTEMRIAQKDGENVLGSLVVKISEDVLTKAVKR